ncbi:MAG: response regulator transcription factor [Bacilli bacterium]
MQSILVIDDEPEIADLLELYLLNENYQVYKFYSAENVMAFLSENKVDLAILDIMMPDINGYELCTEIRKSYNFPIVFLTAKTGEVDKINGFSLGADDYVEKPFKSFELIARVKAHLRRYGIYGSNKKCEDNINIRGISISKSRHEMFLENKKLNLTPIEFSIMWVLCKNKNRVVTNDELFKEVWKEKYYDGDSNTVMVHIRHLREKMYDTGPTPKYITTVWGIGYEIKE